MDTALVGEQAKRVTVTGAPSIKVFVIAGTSFVAASLILWIVFFVLWFVNPPEPDPVPCYYEDLRVTVAQGIRAYFNNLDLHNWDDAMDFFEPIYFSDYDIEGAKPQWINRTTNWLVWPCFLAGFNSTHHQLGNVVVNISSPTNPDSPSGPLCFSSSAMSGTNTSSVAHVVLKGTATHNCNNSLWVTAGIYHMQLRASSSNSLYRLFKITYTQHWTTGDEQTLSLLAANAAWAQNSAFCAAHGGVKPKPPLSQS